MPKQLYGKALATALLLGAVATGAHAQNAQFAVTGAYVTSNKDTANHAVVAAPGNTNTLAAFQTIISNAFTVGTGGDITFDNITAAPGFTVAAAGTTFTPANSFQGLYGLSNALTETITSAPSTGTAQNFDYNTNNAGGVTSQGGAAQSYAPGYLGANGTAPTDYNYTFSTGLSDFGIIVLDRQSERDLSFSVTLSNGSTVNVSGASQVVTSTDATGPTFFEYSAAPGVSITHADLFTGTNGGAVRIDDLGFVTAIAPAAAPEPSQYAAFAIGIVGVGMLALRARKRSLLA